MKLSLLIGTSLILNSSLVFAQQAKSKRVQQSRAATQQAPLKNQGTDSNVSRIKSSRSLSPTATMQKVRSNTHILPEKKETDDGGVKFSMGVSAARLVQASTQEDGKRSEGMGYSLSPSLKVGSISASLLVGYSQDLKNSSESDWDDSELKLGLYSTEAFDIWKFNAGVKGVIPLSKASREVRELKTSITPAFSLSLDSKKVGAENTSLTFITSLSRNFHNATTDAVKGDPLTQYSWQKGVVGGYSFPLKMPLSFELTFVHLSNFSYENVVRESFVHEQAAELGLTKDFSFKLAHFNKAPMYKAPTYTYNLKFLDKSSSYYYAEVSYKF